ncbi:MAG: tetratricopeptide repeat protein [Ignavibacteria bacterium]|nr:tetratricopeptide repeat protein [Ignavibacteria bacterium]
MLKPKRKIGKKELKQDALITTYAKVTAAYEEYKKPLGIGLAVAVVSVLAIVAYMNNQSTNEQKAAVQLAEIVPYFDSGDFNVAIEGIPEQNLAGLRAIVDNYGGTTSGDYARFYLARALFQLDSYDEALDLYSDFSGNGDLLRSARAAGMAACYEGKGQFLEAAEAYEQAAAYDGPENLAAQHLNNSGHNYARAGMKEKAVAMFEKLKKTYPTSMYGLSADRFLAGLSG